MQKVLFKALTMFEQYERIVVLTLFTLFGQICQSLNVNTNNMERGHGGDFQVNTNIVANMRTEEEGQKITNMTQTRPNMRTNTVPTTVNDILIGTAICQCPAVAGLQVFASQFRLSPKTEHAGVLTFKRSDREPSTNFTHLLSGPTLSVAGLSSPSLFPLLSSRSSSLMPQLFLSSSKVNSAQFSLTEGTVDQNDGHDEAQFYCGNNLAELTPNVSCLSNGLYLCERQQRIAILIGVHCPPAPESGSDTKKAKTESGINSKPTKFGPQNPESSMEKFQPGHGGKGKKLVPTTPEIERKSSVFWWKEKTVFRRTGNTSPSSEKQHTTQFRRPQAKSTIITKIRMKKQPQNTVREVAPPLSMSNKLSTDTKIKVTTQRIEAEKAQRSIAENSSDSTASRDSAKKTPTLSGFKQQPARGFRQTAANLDCNQSRTSRDNCLRTQRCFCDGLQYNVSANFCGYDLTGTDCRPDVVYHCRQNAPPLPFRFCTFGCHGGGECHSRPEPSSPPLTVESSGPNSMDNASTHVPTESTTRPLSCGTVRIAKITGTLGTPPTPNCTMNSEREGSKKFPQTSTATKRPMSVQRPFSGSRRNEPVDDWLEHETVTFAPVIRNALIDT